MGSCYSIIGPDRFGCYSVVAPGRAGDIIMAGLTELGARLLMASQNTLTPYGPGKFDYMVDVLAWEASMDGADREAGDCQENGEHYSLVYSVEGPLDLVGADKLSAFDLAFLARQRAAIVQENDQGFVSVEWFTDASRAEAEMDRLDETLGVAMEDDSGDDVCGCL